MDKDTFKAIKRAAPKLRRCMKQYLSADELKAFPRWTKEELELNTVYIRVVLVEDMLKPHSKLYSFFGQEKKLWLGEAAKKMLITYQEFLRGKE